MHVKYCCKYSFEKEIEFHIAEEPVRLQNTRSTFAAVAEQQGYLNEMYRVCAHGRIQCVKLE